MGRAMQAPARRNRQQPQGLGALISAGPDEYTSINLRRRRAAGVAGLRRLKAATTLGWEHIDALST